MKRVIHDSKARDKTLHIETEYGIINIRVGLTNMDRIPTESIEIIADGDCMFVDDPARRGMNIRLQRRISGTDRVHMSR